MADNERKTVQPNSDAEQWTDEQINALVGITDDGKVSPAVLGDAKADARKYPELNALLNAKPVNDDRRRR